MVPSNDVKPPAPTSGNHGARIPVLFFTWSLGMFYVLQMANQGITSYLTLIREYTIRFRSLPENPGVDCTHAGCHGRPGETLFHKSASLVSHHPTLEFCHVEQFP